MRQTIFDQISLERDLQDKKWGEQNHDPILWCAILGEEVGEVQKSALEARFANSPHPFQRLMKEYREELIQVAAVAVSMIECLDRNSK